jgi:hypothetical protein
MMKKIYVLFLIISGSTSVWGQTTYVWNQTGTASWALPTNWTPTRTTPAPDDILQFNNGATTNVTNVPTQTIGSLQVSAATIVTLTTSGVIATLSISGVPGTDLTVASGCQLNVAQITNNNAFVISVSTGATGSISGTMDFSSATPATVSQLTAADASGITFNSGSIFTQNTNNTGNVFGSGTSNSVVFASGSIFSQFAGSNPFQKAQPLSVVVFQTGSLFKFQVPSATPSGSGRTYANFEFLGSGAAATMTGGFALVMDNLTVTSGTLNINMTATPGHSIKGNISVTAGAFLNFSPLTAGTLNFNGIAAQSISNGGILTFGANQNVFMNNAAGLTLNAPISLLGTLTFNSGLIKTTSTNLLTMGAGSFVSGASNSSFVNGPVSKIGNNTFKFPVGKPNCGPLSNVNGYAAIEISIYTPAGGLITDQFTAEYVRADPLSIGAITAPGLLPSPPGHISRCDYWTLVRVGGTTSTVDIALYWDNTINNCTTAAPYINKLSSLTVVHSNNPGPWDVMGSIGGIGIPALNTTTGYVPWTGTQSGTFGAFAIASNDAFNPLPISINYFNGTKNNGNHLLNWKVTCVSTPSATLELERSTDGRNYSGIYSIFATALRCQQPFDYTDNQPAKGINYYRLKMTDVDGKLTYSSVVTLINAVKGIDIMNIAPNPIVNSQFNLQISTAQNTKMDIVITDMMGRVMQKHTVSMIAGFNTIPMKVANLAAGTYQLFGNTEEGRSRVLRFVIQ